MCDQPRGARWVSGEVFDAATSPRLQNAVVLTWLPGMHAQTVHQNAQLVPSDPVVTEGAAIDRSNPSAKNALTLDLSAHSHFFARDLPLHKDQRVRGGNTQLQQASCFMQRCSTTHVGSDDVNLWHDLAFSSTRACTCVCRNS